MVISGRMIKQHLIMEFFHQEVLMGACLSSAYVSVPPLHFVEECKYKWIGVDNLHLVKTVIKIIAIAECL
ncbi:unnamed protein product [Rhodiola kirilowii]